MNIDKFRDFVLFLANKSQSADYFTPDEFNIAVERGYLEWFLYKYNNDKEYTPGQEIPKNAWQKTQKNTDDLSFLLKKVELSVDADGILLLPADYLHLSSIRSKLIEVVGGNVIVKEKFVDVLRDSELSHVLNSTIVHPTLKYPVCVFYDGEVQLYPKEIQRVVLTYLRMPEIPKWAFTVSPSGRPIYDSTNSVDLEAKEDSINDIAVRVLAYLGIHMRDMQVQQYAQAMKQQGI